MSYAPVQGVRAPCSEQTGADPLSAAEALAGTSFFSGLSGLELARLVPDLEERRYEAGEVIFCQGEAPDGLYIIRDGRARVIAEEGSRKTMLASLGPRECFGEMALVSAQPRSASVEAITPLETWRLSTDRFRELTERYPSLPLEVAASLSLRLAATNGALARVGDWPKSRIGDVAEMASTLDVERERGSQVTSDDVAVEDVSVDDVAVNVAAPALRAVAAPRQVPGRGLLERVASMLRSRPSTRTALAVISAMALVEAWFGPRPPGMSEAAFHALLLLLGSLGVSLLGVLPDCITFLLMLALWVSFDIVPAPVAESGFANPTWVLMLATMAITAGLARSGLLYRGVLELLKRLPARYPVLAGSMAGLGLLLTPGLPYTGGRVSLVAPIALDVADSLRYRPRGGGAAGLVLAAFLGSGLMGSLFLTGNPGALVLVGFLSPEQREHVTFGSWLLASLPLHLVIFGGSLTFILRHYKPDDEVLSRERLEVQRAVLGPVRGGEWLALAVLLGLLVGFATTSLHGIEPAWLAVFGVVVMCAGRLLDAETLRRGVNWQLLVYLGVTLSLGAVLREVGLDAWVAGAIHMLFGWANLPSGLLLVGIGLLALGLSLVLGASPAVLLMALALFPIAEQLGMSPLVVTLTLLVCTNQWLYPQQNVLYAMLHSVTEGRAFSYAQARPASIVFAALTLLGLAVSVPCWYSLGLLH